MQRVRADASESFAGFLTVDAPGPAAGSTFAFSQFFNNPFDPTFPRFNELG